MHLPDRHLPYLIEILLQAPPAAHRVATSIVQSITTCMKIRLLIIITLILASLLFLFSCNKENRAAASERQYLYR
jgi:heme/copper-type cytochrome/quinol oxidase subunit 2